MSEGEELVAMMSLNVRMGDLLQEWSLTSMGSRDSSPVLHRT
jgi:hypothetical protein